MNKVLYIYILLVSFAVFSQKKTGLPKPLDEYTLIKTGDTLQIDLEEFSLLPQHKFKSQEDVRYYYWFKRRVLNTYPYAILASKRLDTLTVRLSRIKSKRKRKKYSLRVQKYLKGEFTEQLKKMTHTEGRILIKLIHRQTGKTAYHIIRNLRSGWKAFWYNTTAVLFKLSLKNTYQPGEVNEDFLIESILQQSFMDEKLIRSSSKVLFDFEKIAAKKKGEINVEAYKKLFKKRKKNKKKRTKKKK